MRTNRSVLAVIALAVVVAATWLAASADDDGAVSTTTPSSVDLTPTTTDPTSGPTGAAPSTTDAPGTAAPRAFSDLPAISRSELPPEAIEVLALIDDGGPYPYRQDDGVFQNREGLLPDRTSGHYREFTVPTPGSDDRGARRIVSGADGERYYTDDHYDSFRELVDP